MVGGGIGVTPYASTLMDLVKEKYSENHCNVRCKKVYFFWICPSHKNFEWFVDVLKEVEKLDRDKILEIHVFVTQVISKTIICHIHFFSSSTNSISAPQFW
jgi:predicted ferric reductase